MAVCQTRESSAYRGRILTPEIWELKERSSLFYHMTIFQTRGKRPARKVKDSKEGAKATQN